MMNNNLPKGIQNNLIKNLQESGCYFLSIIHIAEINSKYLAVDIIRYAQECIDKGWLCEDFTVKRPDKILGTLVNKQVSVISVPAADFSKVDKYNAKINCWYNPRTRFTHFNLDDWDSLSNSITVKEGSITSYRLFTW